MKAITIWQPYASAIALGYKRYETRTWSTKHRGLIAIHAAAKNDYQIRRSMVYVRRDLEGFRDQLDWMLTAPVGVVVAVCELVAVHDTRDVAKDIDLFERAFGNWQTSRYAWELKLIERFEQPIPARGAQGLWNWQEGETS